MLRSRLAPPSLLSLLLLACNVQQPEAAPAPAPSEPAPAQAEPAQAEPAQAEPAAAEPHCDVEALAALAARVEAAAEAERAKLAWPGIEAACGELLPEVARSFFRDALAGAQPSTEVPPSAALRRFQMIGCPEVELVERSIVEAPVDAHGLLSWEGCNIGRFEGFIDGDLQGTRAGYMSWSLHQLLLNEGLATPQAVTLTRAVFELERATMPAAKAPP